MEGKPLKDLFSFDISPYAQWQVYPSGGVIFPVGGAHPAGLSGGGPGQVHHQFGKRGGDHPGFRPGPLLFGGNGAVGGAGDERRGDRADGMPRLGDPMGALPGEDAGRPGVPSGAVRGIQRESRTGDGGGGAEPKLSPEKPVGHLPAEHPAPGGVSGAPCPGPQTYLGVSYRHLLSVLAAFQREGLVEKTPEGYHLRDWAGLRAPANSGCCRPKKAVEGSV